MINEIVNYGQFFPYMFGSVYASLINIVNLMSFKSLKEATDKQIWLKSYKFNDQVRLVIIWRLNRYNLAILITKYLLKIILKGL